MCMRMHMCMECQTGHVVGMPGLCLQNRLSKTGAWIAHRIKTVKAL